MEDAWTSGEVLAQLLARLFLKAAIGLLLATWFALVVASLSSPASPPPPPAASPGETGLFGTVCCPVIISFWAIPCCLLFFLAITTAFIIRFGQVCTSFSDFTSTLSFLLRPQMFSISSSQDNSQYGGGLTHSGVHRLKILLAKRLRSHTESTIETVHKRWSQKPPYLVRAILCLHFSVWKDN